MYIQRQVFIYAIFAIKPKLKSVWSHLFFTNKVCKKVGYQNILSAVNWRFVINYIAQ
jgi:hypothetical protein